MIDFGSYKTESLPGVKIKIVHGTLAGNKKNAVGVDPGVNFGMTVIDGPKVTAMWGKLKSTKTPGLKGIEAYDLMRLSTFLWDWEVPVTAVVEGAAYSKYHKQVELEEVRFGFYLALHHLGFKVHILPPATIRKMVFGAGRTQAGDVYVKLNHNAADSVGAALAALEL